MEAAAEPVFPLMALPPDLVDRIAYLLPPDDRGNLAATCIALRVSSLYWFKGGVVRVRSDRSRLAELARWLKERQGLGAFSSLNFIQMDGDAICAALATLPPGCVGAISASDTEWVTPAALSGMTALSRLSLDRQPQLGSGSHMGQLLQPLAQLRDLTIRACELTAVPAALSRCTLLTSLSLRERELLGSVQHLQPLRQLESLMLGGLRSIPESLEQLMQVTALELIGAESVATGSRHLTALRLLRSLSMGACGISEVLAALSTLTALTSLSLSFNPLQSGFDNLRPLQQLRVLKLFQTRINAVPAAVSALTALAQLHLTSGLDIRAGWEHLRPLAQLCKLGVLWDSDDLAELEAASKAARNLHPAAVEGMLVQPFEQLPRLLRALAQRGLPSPV